MLSSTFRLLDWEYSDEFTMREVVESLGKLPEFVFTNDNRPIMEQIDERAPCGWTTFEDSDWSFTADNCIYYQNLPPLVPRARAEHMGETIYAYPHGFVVILHTNNSFSLSRLT